MSPVKLVNAPLSAKLVRGSDKVAPLGDNTGLLNRASRLVDSVTSIVRSVIGTSYNQTTLTNTHRNNNHSRTHNQRPYERNWNGNRHHSTNWNRNSPRRNNRTNSPRRNFNSPRRERNGEISIIVPITTMPCGGPKKSPRTSSIVQIIFFF